MPKEMKLFYAPRIEISKNFIAKAKEN